jgi:hypothetical protein
MAAVAKKPVVSKKRKVSNDGPDLLSSGPTPSETKKKSPLFNRPQNFYAPPPVPMTKDELSEWRKEQRRERNRESAAASRNKTRSRIEELEGEVKNWKFKCQDMEAKVRSMERHIDFLTKLCGSHKPQFLPPQPTTAVSHPNSPPRSDSPPTSSPVQGGVPLVVFPNPVSSFSPPLVPDFALRPHTIPDPFPALLSEPKDNATVEEAEVAIPPIIEAVVGPAEESKEHINPINSRQA